MKSYSIILNAVSARAALLPNPSGVPPFTKCKGVALITALLVIAFVSVASAAMISRQHLDVRRTENIMHGDQALMYALAAESIAGDVLLKDPEPNYDTLEEIELANTVLAAMSASIPIQGGGINLVIADLSGRFPLNNLIDKNGGADPKYVKGLQYLFTDLKWTDEENNRVVEVKPELASVIQDWIDKDDNAANNGAEGPYYLGRPLPYLTANQPLISPTELRLMAEMSNDEYNLLTAPPDGSSPYVNTLPTGAVINVNTAPKEVIMSLHDKIDKDIAEKIISERQSDQAPANAVNSSSGFTDKSKFEKLAKDEIKSSLSGLTQQEKTKILNDFAKDSLQYDVKSKYFELKTTINVGRSEIRLISILERNMTDKKVKTLRRGIGVL